MVMTCDSASGYYGRRCLEGDFGEARTGLFRGSVDDGPISPSRDDWHMGEACCCEPIARSRGARTVIQTELFGICAAPFSHVFSNFTPSLGGFLVVLVTLVVVPGFSSLGGCPILPAGRFTGALLALIALSGSGFVEEDELLAAFGVVDFGTGGFDIGGFDAGIVDSCVVLPGVFLAEDGGTFWLVDAAAVEAVFVAVVTVVALSPCVIGFGGAVSFASFGACFAAGTVVLSAFVAGLASVPCEPVTEPFRLVSSALRSAQKVSLVPVFVDSA